MIIECNEIQHQIVVYRHRRMDNNEIFYIGIGSLKRSKAKDGRSRFWNRIINKTSYQVEIITENLDWQSACELEVLLIQEYGRIDIKTGCLVNHTDGGDGRYNSRNSEESIKRTMKGSIGRKISEETRLKMRLNKPYSKKVIDIETNIIYNSASEVSRLFSINENTLRSYLLGLRKNKTNFKYIKL